MKDSSVPPRRSTESVAKSLVASKKPRYSVEKIRKEKKKAGVYIMDCSVSDPFHFDMDPT